MGKYHTINQEDRRLSTREVVESKIEDLRVSDLLAYFEHSGRSSKCPSCDHYGRWEFHIKLDPETRQAEEDAVLIPFKLAMDGNTDSWTKCAAMTCPQCGHLSLISMYKIADFKSYKGGFRG